MGKLLRRLLNARVSVSSWLWLFSNITLGAYALAVAILEPGLLGDFGTGLAINPVAWAAVLTAGCLFLGFGLARDNHFLMRTGSMACFVMWVFGAVSFLLTGGAVSAIVIALPYLLFFMYIFL